MLYESAVRFYVYPFGSSSSVIIFSQSLFITFRNEFEFQLNRRCRHRRLCYAKCVFFFHFLLVHNKSHTLQNANVKKSLTVNFHYHPYLYILSVTFISVINVRGLRENRFCKPRGYHDGFFFLPRTHDTNT